MKKRNTLVGPQLQLPATGINWHRGRFLLLPIAIGMVAATQFAAHSLDYDRALGPNFYRLYPPWGYFVWSGLWSHINPHLFSKAAGAGVLAILGSFLLIILLMHRTAFRVNPFLHGSARWADERDIKAAGLLNNNGVYVGAWRDKRGTIRYLRHNTYWFRRTRSSNTP
jgi:type IV secretion system protein VirD4